MNVNADRSTGQGRRWRAGRGGNSAMNADSRQDQGALTMPKRAMMAAMMRREARNSDDIMVGYFWDGKRCDELKLFIL
jgi:hypothetical protein